MQHSNDNKLLKLVRGIEDFHQRAIPYFYRFERWLVDRFRRLSGRPRSVSEGPNLLPVLIRVLAGFTKVDGEIQEEEVDSILGFLRYDYPDAVYSELRSLFRQALDEQHNLSEMAKRLSKELPPDHKLLLCVQLYDLISKAGMQSDQLAVYYEFMLDLDMAVQAIEIVHQLNSENEFPNDGELEADPHLEILKFGATTESSDVLLNTLADDEVIRVYRYHDLVLLKNLSHSPILVRGRAVKPPEFCRIYPGQRIILRGQVISYQDLLFYFNAKKGVSVPEVYLKLNSDDEVEITRSRERESVLRVAFGLNVELEALKEVHAKVADKLLRPGKVVTAVLEDLIVFHGDSTLELMDLRRRARAMGGRFKLQPSKSEYLVSNNPSRLGADDILLSPGTSGEILLRISCNYEELNGELEVLESDRPIVVRGQPVRNRVALQDGDLVRINSGQVLRCDFSERIIEERRNIIRSLDIRDLRVRFSNGETGLDGVSFDVRRGEMVCVMGASGSGKSTLLQCIAGQLPPSAGEISMNGLSLYPNLAKLKGYISFVPQDDAFDEHLTVEENLDYAAAMRAPHLSNRDRSRRVSGKLLELGLIERRGSQVGMPNKKTLSGGERKRLNIGLDMIGNADVYLLDEPTSGLSSKDSEHVIDIIRGISHNKIVLVTIHQPSAKLFHMFQKAILLDKGGKLVFFGTPNEMLRYFAKAEQDRHPGIFDAVRDYSDEVGPEFVFDVLETPLRDLGGDVIYEENKDGQLIPARRYSPDYWRDKYESYRLMQDVEQVSVKRQDAAPDTMVMPELRQEHLRWHDEWTQFVAQLQRAFLSKLRNRANILTTMVEAPMLAALFGVVLRFSESGTYNFATAFHIPTYMFLALVVAMFLGLTNSADDIIRDRSILKRERNLNLRLWYYIISKLFTLALFAFLQCLLFVWIGSAILEIRGVFWMQVWYMFVTALSGISIGLLISTLVSDAKTAVNILPLVLIPQIILGGALIKYEEMNQNLDFVHVLDRWVRNHPEAAENAPRSDLEVPWISQWMPIRWSYEALIVDLAKNNPLTRRQMAVQQQVDQLKITAKSDQAAADQLKYSLQVLAAVTGLEAVSESAIDSKLSLVDRILEGSVIEVSQLHGKQREISAEQLYVNQKVADLVTTAEIEQEDYLRTERVNVFFGPEKWHLGRTWSVFQFNVIILNIFTVFVLILLHISLRSQLSIRVVSPKKQPSRKLIVNQQ